MEVVSEVRRERAEILGIDVDAIVAHAIAKGVSTVCSASTWATDLLDSVEYDVLAGFAVDPRWMKPKAR